MRKFLFLATLCIVLASSLHATAQSRYSAVNARAGGYAWANRDLVAQKMQLQVLTGPTSAQGLSLLTPVYASQYGQSASPEFGVNIRNYHIRQGERGSRTSFSTTHASWPMGFAFGPVENLEVGMALPFYLSPGDFGDVPFWLAYRFTDGKVQVGGRLSLVLPTATDFQIQLGVPILIRGDRYRIDTGAFVHLTFSDPVFTVVNLPVRMGFQITPEFYAGFQSGVMFSLSQRFFDFTVPAYGFVGYTFPTRGSTLVDIGMRFGFDHLISAGDGARSGVDVGDFSFAFGGNFGFQF